ncbi:hypothetical protein G6F57_010572 [Rhizopus arrhizus]|uniref:GTP-binding protein 8 n=1 Tax=Rhizopus oryzae TaxID=64495 RepID=A0A9P6XKQ7_RHIOR|nr:hypothetical protein G6F23_006597 [Rhizopus arrhizus]KAG1414692.1 hypothetical protein G6F58_006827 [Rhizopus delemar]KAG0770587.1 hypothetical protein G6F24_000096 [Rhizopus arrhizus]KAG0783651.1 hypothetical protein G6F21_010407 [Rhizopus arrhizus]KAG0796910.1 hypothetical protein G6F22_004809 [Rhizopus arrhizus]
MLRTVASQTSRFPFWRVSAQYYSTENTPGLAERLGAGRGKTVSERNDPFASFLSKRSSQGEHKSSRNENKNKRGNGLMSSRNNNNQRGRQQQQKPAVEGQFADAEPTKIPAIEKKTTEAAKELKKDARNPRQDGNRRNNNRKPRVKHEAVRAHRAVSFIDKDIDWASLDVIPVQQVSTEAVEGQQQADVNEDDYQPYLSAGTEIKWSDIVKGDVVNSLIGTCFPEQPSLTPLQINAAKKLFSKQVSFIKSISQLEQAPELDKPEVAFVGRSNVGKSTLINTLTNNSKLVKTSSKPGHTRLLNFFNIGNELTIVDMPGYGYRSKAEWGELILDYLTNRRQLKRLFLLVDPIAGLKETDKLLMNQLDKQAISYQVILTKRDKLSQQEFDESRSSIEQYLLKHSICCFPQLLITGKKRKNNHEFIEQELTRVKWAIIYAANKVI